MSLELGIMLFWLVVCLFLFFGLRRTPPVETAPPPDKEPVEPTPPSGVEGLGQWLDQTRRDEEDATRAKQERRNKLVAVWGQIEPIVMRAIELVNAKLTEHGQTRLELSTTPDFADSGESRFAIKCRLAGVFDSNIALYWEDGILVDADGLPIAVTAEAVADALADAVKWAIEKGGRPHPTEG
jgi:hypothetical protein